MARIVYIGSGAQADAGSQMQGIHVLQMDVETGRLKPIQAVTSGANPSFLALSADRRFLFSVNETDDGRASAYKVDPLSGQLSFINQVKVRGDAPCYLCPDPNGCWLLVANYSSGSLSILPIGKDGRLGESHQVVEHIGCSADAQRLLISRDEERTLAVIQLPNADGGLPPGVIPGRQERAHAHSVLLDPSRRYVLSADLGQDRIWIYRLENNGRLTAIGNQVDWHEYGWIGANPGEAVRARQEKLSGKPQSGHSLAPGAGPRHIAFHPNERFLYVSNEMGSTVTAFGWDAGRGELIPLQDLSTLPEGYTGQNDVAHLALTPDGHYLYVSNRGHNSLALFSVDGENGQLLLVGHYSTEGNWPRNFCITPDGRFLLAANQESDSVVVFHLDRQTGHLFASGEAFHAFKPMFVMAVDL